MFYFCDTGSHTQDLALAAVLVDLGTNIKGQILQLSTSEGLRSIRFIFWEADQELLRQSLL